MKLTAKDKKHIIADYGGGNYTRGELAKKYKVCERTIDNIVDDKSNAEKLREIKAKQYANVFDWVKSRTVTATNLIDKILKTTDSDIENASIRDKMGAVKILYECFIEKEKNSNQDKDINIKIDIANLSDCSDCSDGEKENGENNANS